MKVLNQRGWDGLRIHCPHCRSLLLVETDDVFFSLVDKGTFYAVSGCCGLDFSIREDLLPENVAFDARQKVYRGRMGPPVSVVV